MEPENKSFFRFPATKISVLDLEEGEYIEEKEHNPNYLLIKEHQKIFRINVIATLVHKEMKGSISSMLVDDGTGKIVMRIFEENKAALNLEVGDVIEIIGKVRVYNQEKYIFPEIIRKVNPLWLKVRYLEMRSGSPVVSNNIQNSEKEISNSKKIELQKEKNIKEISPLADPIPAKAEETAFQVIDEEIEENDPLLPLEKLSKLIARLDQGEGVLIEEVIEKSPLEKTEELLEKMLENGDIFQNQPGKVRLL